ncbi:alternative ribosome rescue aminoacyl-tRNA hydrolase ArfB [Alteraurantiacibacter buctensis]|uniref:Aminoacyl-tRNA hydrolase n=1 Tax=Alteraurantiacibacter buctensis TaxID=1503981 RepID=A0A844YTY6_9SPHN|nr:alternative ribosome rescue aminoacyl-tRNA hydrolase ArfB [Alteraurantiacibacter buctensis]MXO70331.1 aminoacyl-tRNA hydrolase [Alteraurantiacibacter buctensis]
MHAVVQRALSLAEESFVTASGPGGQNVNKVATAVQLRVNIYALGLTPAVFQRLKALAGSRLSNAGDIVLDARRFRTQEANRADARERLAEMIEAALKEPKARKKTTVNRPGKVQRLAAKKVRSTVKANRGKVDW